MTNKETVDELLTRQSKELQELQELQSTDDATDKTQPAPGSEGKKSADVDKLKEEDWKDGYTEFEIKTKTSDRLLFKEDEIEITEEMLD